jgi:hypothetical protein
MTTLDHGAHLFYNCKKPRHLSRSVQNLWRTRLNEVRRKDVRDFAPKLKEHAQNHDYNESVKKSTDNDGYI